MPALFPVDRAILDTLRQGALTARMLESRLPEIPPSTLRARLVELLRTARIASKRCPKTGPYVLVKGMPHGRRQ